MTLEEVGNLFGITRERVRQLQNIALSKMRKVMYNYEQQLSIEEIQEKNRQHDRMEVFREFLHNKALEEANT
ncbi:MAG: hypothetical protein JKY51_07760 [Opitutaceae bacterium]|nr:hypothetical protein [Opitutaceae bacterium]